MYNPCKLFITAKEEYMKKFLVLTSLLWGMQLFSQIALADTPWRQTPRSADASIKIENGQFFLTGDAVCSTTLTGVKPDSAVMVTVKVSGNGQAMAYLESFGKNKSRISTSTARFNVSGKENIRSFVLDIPADWKAPIRVVLRSTENSQVTFSGLSVKAVPKPLSAEETIAAIRIGDPGWNSSLRSKDAGVYADRKLNQAVIKDEAIYSYTLSKVPDNCRITISVEVRGKGNYRVYAESFGKPVMINSDWSELPAPGSFTGHISSIIVPAGWKNPVIIRLRTKKGAEVTFRDLKVTVEKFENISQLGKQWEPYGNSKAAKFPDGMAGVFIDRFCNRSGATLPGFKFLPGKIYEVQYYVQGSGKTANPTGMHQYRLEIIADADKKRITFLPWEDAFRNKAILRTCRIRIPDGVTGTCGIGFRIYGDSRLLVSMVSCKEVIPKPGENFRMVLSSPAMRGNIYASDPVKNISGRVIAPGAKQCKISCQGKVFASEKQGDSFFFSVPLAQLDMGKKLLLSADLTDGSGKLIRRLTREINILVPAKNEVVILEDGFFQVEGKKFFPIISWRLNIADDENGNALLAHMKAAGFNVILHQAAFNEKANLRILELFRKHGMYVIFGLPLAVSPEKFDKFTDTVKKVITPAVASHPALFGWFSVDEPAWTGVSLPLLLKSYELYKKLDPYHPVWINAAPPSDRETLRLFSQAADIYGVDIYPVPKPQNSVIPDKTIAIVGKQCRYTVDAMDNGKPVWMTLQAFAWNDSGHAIGTVSQYPSYRQLRFMAFDALLNGSKGVAWWSLGRTPAAVTPAYRQFLTDLWKVNRELAEMADILPATGKVTYLSNGVTEKEWNFPAGKVIIALNTTKTDAVYGNEKIAPYEVKKIINGTVPPLRKLPAAPGAGDQLFMSMKTIKGTLYSGKACWVWAEDSFNESFSTAVLGKVINVPADAVKVELICSVDDYGEVYLNGKSAGRFDGWNKMKYFDLTGKVKKGENLLLLKVEDGPKTPHGAIAEVRITRKDGSVTKIVSDSSWCGSVSADIKNVDAAALNRWKQVKIITPYGGGSWKNRVIIPEKYVNK